MGMNLSEIFCSPRNMKPIIIFQQIFSCCLLYMLIRVQKKQFFITDLLCLNWNKMSPVHFLFLSAKKKKKAELV